MTILITVKHNILKDLVNKLLNNGIDFEFNNMRCSFRIKGITQWMLLTDKDCYLLSAKLATAREVIEIQKDNIEQLCIAESD